MGSAARFDTPDSFASAFSISRETLEKFVTYERLLRLWQKTINLVATSTLDDVWHRHFADSAQLWCHRPEAAKTWIDFGSGAGFPGLVLAILAFETGQSRHILVESDSRKAAFLREVSRETGVAVDILCMRIENPETQGKVASADCVTARALAPLPRLLDYVAPHFMPSTVGLFLKGRDIVSELEEAVRTWKFAYELKPSMTDAEARVLLIKALKTKPFQSQTEG